MKKNLRIVSAAAAALLAVAPVAASSVSTVFADTDVSVDAGSTDSSKSATLNLNVKNAFKLAENASASSLKVSLATPVLPKGAAVSVSKAKIYKTGDVSTARGTNGQLTTPPDTSKLVNTLKADDGSYRAVAYVSISGLAGDTDYTITTDGHPYTVHTSQTGTITDFPVISSEFSLSDATKLGAPFLKENKTNGKAVANGLVHLSNGQYSVAGVVSAITADNTGYTVDITDNTPNKATAHLTDLNQDVRDALKLAGINVDQDGNFAKPAAPFNVTVNMYATNGKTSTATVTVDPNTDSDVADSSFPRIIYNVKNYATNATTGTETTFPVANNSSATGTVDIDTLVDSSNNDLKLNYIPVNSTVDVAAIKRAFHAQVSEGNRTPLDLTVDASKVNTKVAGKYPVVVSATNADKKTTKLTFMLTVGDKGATYKTVQSDGDVPVYKIEGNTVTDTKTTVKNGDQIAVFGDAIKVGDKSYTRINSADSNLYVETKYVDGSFKPADKTSKTVMHNAYIYDKDHKRVGTNMLRAYTKVDVLGAATKLADGSLVYQIGDNQYVMADNIDGTVRTLSHNAYVYKTSKKRADSRVLRKGAKVTTYGSPYTFKNGKAYYRIGGPSKQYVKVANFN